MAGRKKLDPRTREVGNVVIEILQAARLTERERDVTMARQLWTSISPEEQETTAFALANMVNTMAGLLHILPEDLEAMIRKNFQIP